jgi:Fic family protein
MYTPKYVITNSILRNIGQVEAAKDVIENAPLVPDFVKDFKSDAIVRTVYHGTQIEGNDLTLIQTKQVLEGETIIARDRDIQEVINYRNVTELLDQLAVKRGGYDMESLFEIHRTTVDKLVDPVKVGALRNTQVVIKEEGTGRVIFTPPPAVEVPYLIQDFLDWLNSVESTDVHPIIRAGMTHYVMVTIHPFIEGNGRTVRAFSTLVMLREGYDIKRFFAIEEHFDRDLAAYYAAFFKVDNQGGDISSRDLTPWLEYFSGVVAIELTKIKEKVRQLSIDTRLKVKIGEQVALSARQMKLIEYLSEHGSAIMKDLRDILPMISEDTVLRDLKDMQHKNIIDKEGSTKAARYVLKH